MARSQFVGAMGPALPTKPAPVVAWRLAFTGTAVEVLVLFPNLLMAMMMGIPVGVEEVLTLTLTLVTPEEPVAVMVVDV